MSAYEDFFKQAKFNARQGEDVAAPKSRPPIKRRRRKAAKPPVKTIVFMFVGLMSALGGLVYIDDLDEILETIHIGAFPGAIAAEEGKEKKESGDAEKKDAKKEMAEKAAAKKKSIKNWTDKDLGFLNKLSDRKEQLDRREKELNKVEEELLRQKRVLDKKIAKLSQIRAEISKILKNRIEMDDTKISKLVEFYSNMKPQQAAQVFAEINENLAVEVLGRMKKKNAAAIMNLLKPDKAQVLSEKFAGYRSPAEE